MLPCQTQVTADTKISVVFSLEPQLTSILGFHTTLFQQSFQVNLSSRGASEFPGGNLVVDVVPPSEKYRVSFNLSIPKLMPNSSYVELCTFKPQEAGVYTIKVLYLDTPTRKIMPSEIEGGFLAEDFKGPEVAYTLIFGAIGAVLAILTYYSRKTKRKRK